MGVGGTAGKSGGSGKSQADGGVLGGTLGKQQPGCPALLRTFMMDLHLGQEARRAQVPLASLGASAGEGCRRWEGRQPEHPGEGVSVGGPGGGGQFPSPPAAEKLEKETSKSGVEPSARDSH